MKKIFYSLMAVALCACAQSEVEDIVTPPQPENDGLKFEVVDNGYLNEDGTRVTYGEYGTADAYRATFEEGDAIGVYAIKSSDMADDKTPNAYVVENAKLTLTNGIWKGSVDFKDADLLFAYAPYRADVNLGDGKPLFTGAQGSWAVSTDNNRFFVHPYLTVDNGTKEKFEAADWMGAAVNLTGAEETITFQMQHMRGMVELTTDKNVELTDLTLAIGGDNGAQYHFTPYFVNEADASRTQNVYRILTTEYRSKNTIYATIKDQNIVKKFKKTPSNNNSVGAGVCVRVNINYVPKQILEIGTSETLATILTERYGDDYATDPALTSLRLSGTLQEADWATLKSLTKLQTLDMYNLNNESIPEALLEGNATLTTLILPNKLKTIGRNSLQVKNVSSIDIPATVTTIATGAFWNCGQLSVRIPENSKLKTVGNGAFWALASVHTYENYLNLLVLPATLTEIGRDGAFAHIKQLKKVVFKGETAPTINNEGTAAFKGTNAVINVPRREGYYGQFPGKTVFVEGPTLVVDNYSSPFTNGEGTGLAALCDGITGDGDKFWHSDWVTSRNYDEWGVYIDIALPREYNSLIVSYTTRSTTANGCPKRVKMAVSNDGTNYTAVYEAKDLPQTANTTKVLDTPIVTSDNSSYKYVRFAIVESAAGVAENAQNSKVFANLSELTLYKETWTEAE